MGSSTLRSYWRAATALAVLGLIFVIARSGQIQAQTAAGVTVFEGARLITGDGSAPIENAAFVVDGARFTQVGRAGQVRLPAGAKRVDLRGKTVMPGIIDTHVHMPTNRAELIDRLQRKAYFGVAAVASLGLDTDLALQFRNEVIPGTPRMKTAGRGITMPEPGRTDVPYWVTSPAEARKAVSELAARKVDLIKMWVDDRNGQYKKLTPDIYSAVIEDAHKAGIPVTAHIFNLSDAKGLLRAGLDSFAHSVRDMDADDELMTLLRARPNFVQIPNLPDRGVVADLSWLAGTMPDDELKKLQAASTDRPPAQQAFGIQARNLAKLSKAGVKIAMGTDGDVSWGHLLEMEDMVVSGMTPAQVIVSSTKVGAEFLKLTDMGTIATGKSADFIVLDANPLDDIKNARRIADVYLRGAAVDRAATRARMAGK